MHKLSTAWKKLCMWKGSVHHRCVSKSSFKWSCIKWSCKGSRLSGKNNSISEPVLLWVILLWVFSELQQYISNIWCHLRWRWRDEMKKITQLTKSTRSNKQSDYALNSHLQTIILSMIVKNRFFLFIYFTYICFTYFYNIEPDLNF